MPRIPVSEFDKEPSVGDKVKVVGKVKEIEDGMVEISYDEVKILNKKDKDRDESDNSDESMVDGNMTTDEALDTFFDQNR